MLLDTSSQSMNALYVNSMWQQKCSTPKADAVGKAFSDLFKVGHTGIALWCS